MKYFMFAICWSQTDHDYVVVKARDKESAEKALRHEYHCAHHFEYRGFARELLIVGN